MQPFEADGDVWRTCAFLEHTTASGAIHYDWLLDRGIGQGNPDDRRLRAFRCRLAPGNLAVGAAVAIETMDDHRLLYLSIDRPSPLSGGRGIVRPIARGEWRTLAGAGSERIEIRCDGSEGVLTFDLTDHDLTRAPLPGNR